jgi:hypothetical protein
MSEMEKISAEEFARTVDAVYYDYHGLRDENMAGVDVKHMRVQAELVRRLARLEELSMSASAVNVLLSEYQIEAQGLAAELDALRAERTWLLGVIADCKGECYATVNDACGVPRHPEPEVTE